MNRGSPVCEKLLLQLWNNLGIMGLFTKEQKPRSPHHLQFIMSSKDSDNLDESELAKNEAPKKKTIFDGHGLQSLWMQSIKKHFKLWTSLQRLRKTSTNQNV